MSESWKSQCPLKILKQRAFLLATIREYFRLQNVLEVETPILSSAGNTDINIESFTTSAIKFESNKSYLRTSPEFPLKRLLCSGIGDIFEIGKVFRYGEVSNTHNIEFTMLEWYRIDFNYNELIQDVKSLFKCILSSLNIGIPNSEIITFNECFKQYLNTDINDISVVDINRLCMEHDYCGSELTKDEALDFLFATQVQPQLNISTLTFITLYPATQAALAQINPEDPCTSLRFEVFYQGYELGNGYQELTNANELFNRFKEDNKYRKKNNQAQVQIDKNLIVAMKNGLPDCSGIAIGIDRLIMSIAGIQSVSKVITFNAQNS